MSGWLICLTGIIYLYVGGELLVLGKTGLGIAYICYAGANVGLFIAATSK